MRNNALGFDPQALAALGTSAHAGDTAATRRAAQQFEAEFINMLMKSMRDALPHEDALESDATRSYQGLLDRQWGQALSSKGLGLAAVIERQLAQSSGAATANDGTPAHAGRLHALPARGQAVSVAPATLDALGAHDNKRAFVDRIGAAAQAAAQASGVPAHVIVGHAALESGWGKHEIVAADGAPSHNLFGIKAGAGWKGATVEATTTEVIGGVARKVVEKFRAYASYAEGLADYVKTLATSTRYAGAMRHAADPAQFAAALQRGGYATDPHYAEKLERTIRSASRLA